MIHLSYLNHTPQKVSNRSMNTLAKSGGAWLVSPSLAVAVLRRMRVAGFATSSSSSFLPNLEGGVSMVQGASRGIGLEFVRQLLENSKKGYVVATCRNPKEATSLSDLKNRFSDRLFIQKLDVTDETTIQESAESVRERYGSLNLLINAAGILSIPGVLQPETTLSKVEKSSLMLTYEVNAVGPILMMKNEKWLKVGKENLRANLSYTSPWFAYSPSSMNHKILSLAVLQHMWPLLKAGGGSGTEREVAVVANLSARVGSIGDNRLGGWHSYRASKSALNQLTKNVSVELGRKKDPVVCILLHPGTVDTDLSRPFQRNVPEGKLFTREYSVQKLLHIINNAKKHDNGKFFAWDGQEIPW